jgi:sugar lactone lactonase YvrE
VTPLGNIAAFENSLNPDGQNTASNPWDLARRGGDTYVSDAGANTLLKVDSANQVSLVHVFPNEVVNTPANIPIPNFPSTFPAQAVPTGLTIGPDGALYIAQLSGFPFAPGSADVFRYDFVGAVTTFASGFSNLVDIAAGPDNSLYLLQYSDDFWAAPSGRILRLGLDGSVETLFSDLANPTALAVSPSGKIYVANNADGVNGELLELTPVPTPAPIPLLGVGAAFGCSRKLRKRIKA